MKMKFSALFMAAVLAFGMTACSKTAEVPAPAESQPVEASGGQTSETPAKADVGEVTIQFMHTMVEQDRVELIQTICDAFTEANPGITVEQVPVDEDSYQTKITALGGSGELPQVMELTQDFAKLLSKNQFLDYEATGSIIDSIGKDNIYEGALAALATEDGTGYTAAPMTGWVQGIWYSKSAFAEKGLAAPSTWEDILAAAQAFNDPANKKYGIAIPTANSEFTEQVFSQFALSNTANVFDSEGNATFNTPEMKEALTYYKELAQYTMPGSIDVPEVRDAFMAGTVPMAIYSTWILGSIYEAGTADDLGFVIPSKDDAAAYGNILGLGISADLEDAQKQAAVTFVEYLLAPENNITWLHMSSGGMQPVFKNVAADPAFLENDTLKAFAAIAPDISASFGELKLFGAVDGKNFVNMGDVTGKNIIGSCVYDVVVQGADIDASLEKAQSEIEAIR